MNFGLLRRMFAMRLKAGGERFEIGRGAQALDALQARFQIHQIAPAARAMQALTSSYAKPRMSLK